MGYELKFGSFADDEEAFSASDSAGFPLFFSEDFVRVKVEDDGFVDEDWPTVWRVDSPNGSILVCALLVDGEERNYPGSEPFGNVREYEKQWEWPTWTSQSWVCSNPSRLLPQLTDDVLCEIFQQNAHYELILEREILGLGRSGNVKLSVKSPPTDETLAAAVQLIGSSRLPDLDD